MPVERALSGPALPVIYNFLRAKNLPKEEMKIAPEDIVAKGLAKTDPIAVETLELFVKIYGAEAGNLGTRTLCYGGIYLVGSLTEGMKEYLCSSEGFFVRFS